jgi:hypothetical protein
VREARSKLGEAPARREVALLVARSAKLCEARARWLIRSGIVAVISH